MGKVYDEYDLPVDRKSRILDGLNSLDNEVAPVMISNYTQDDTEEETSVSDDYNSWLSSLATLSTVRVGKKRKTEDLFNTDGKKKKKKKHKGNEKLVDYKKEFEIESALINNLYIENNRFVDSLQQTYDRMTNSKASVRGTGKYTTDLIAGITSARSLSLSLVDKQINLKKTIADLEAKQRKEFGTVNENTTDIENYGSNLLKNIIMNRDVIQNGDNGFVVNDVDENGFNNIFDDIDIDDGRSEDVDKYLKYEKKNVTISILMDEHNPDDYEYIAVTEDGTILDDYPLPERTSLSLNRSTMIATDAYGTKYHVEYK